MPILNTFVIGFLKISEINLYAYNYFDQYWYIFTDLVWFQSAYSMLSTLLPTHSEVDNFQLILSTPLLSLFSGSVVSDSLWPYGLQHARPPCPSPTPRACLNSCPSRQWCHPTILSSVIPLSCLPSFPVSGSFLMSQFFASGGQSNGASSSASVLPMNIQDWFSLGNHLEYQFVVHLISLLNKRIPIA